jgi:hypothetical protein
MSEKTLLDRMRAAGASEAEVDIFYGLTANSGVGPQEAMLRLIADICHGTRFSAEATGSEVTREFRRVHALIRRLAEIHAAPRRAGKS